jgi:hypothetical protein
MHDEENFGHRKHAGMNHEARFDEVGLSSRCPSISHARKMFYPLRRGYYAPLRGYPLTGGNFTLRRGW